jgi:hypothetical protein
LLKGLTTGIRSFPHDFYDSFEHTRTGNNLTHPWTWGLLSKILWDLKGITRVGIDVRFNARNGIKFQPDLVAYAKGKPVLFVDYESPNSSDARVLKKDAKPYLAWVKRRNTGAEYIIITTLPARRCPQWKVRSGSKGSPNYKFRSKRHEIRSNPFEFWYGYYRDKLRGKRLGALSFVNIDGQKVHVPKVGA